MKLKKQISKADYMTLPPQLKIEGKHSYQTPVGGIINIILVLFSIVGSVYFGQELWVKNNPNVVSSQTVNQQVGPFKIDNTEFMVYTGLQFPNKTYFTDPRIATFKAFRSVNRFLDDGGQEYTNDEIEISLCKNYYTQNDISVYDKIDINSFFCPKPNNITVEGFWGAQRSDVVKIEVHKCVNVTENNNHCYSDEQITDLIQGGVLSMFATNTFLNMNDKDKPITLKLQNWLNSLNTDLTINYYYKIKQLVFYDDQGFLIPTEKESKYPYFDSPTIMYYGDRGSVLVEIFISGEKYGQNINRNYDKVQDVLTRIGGLIKAFTIIASIISELSSEFEYYSDTIFNLKYQLHNENLNDSFSKKLSRNHIEQEKSQKSNIDYIQNNTKRKDILSSPKETLDIKEIFSSNKNDRKLNRNTNKINTNEKSHIENKSNVELIKKNNFLEVLKNPDKKLFNQSNNIKDDASNNCKLEAIDKQNKEKSILDRVNENREDNIKDDFKNKVFINTKNSLVFKKNILFLKNCNNRLVETTIPYYSFGSGCKDFFSQFCGFLMCRCSYNKRILTEKENFISKADKMLSINYLFKKLFLLEILTKRNFNENELKALHYPYINQLINRTSCESYIYDDSDAFDLQGLE